MTIEDNVNVPKLGFIVELVDAPGDVVPTVLETWEEVIAYLAKCGKPQAIGSNGLMVRVCCFHRGADA